MNEHENEPVPGLPARLPPGEHIIWQGAPAWRVLARRAFHLRQVAIYFALLLAWSMIAGFSDGESAAALAISAAQIIGLAGGVLAVLGGVAFLTARSTLYTITNRRVVMRFGVALPITFNLPFATMIAAGVKLHADGTGDLPLALKPTERLAYLVMWPHVRPWRVTRAEPMLRCVPDAADVAQLLGRALAAHADQPAPVRVRATTQAADQHAPATA